MKPWYVGPERQTEIGFLLQSRLLRWENAPSVDCAYLQMWISRAYTQFVSNNKLAECEA
jgi:hypothetical protein